MPEEKSSGALQRVGGGQRSTKGLHAILVEKRLTVDGAPGHGDVVPVPVVGGNACAENIAWRFFGLADVNLESAVGVDGEFLIGSAGGIGQRRAVTRRIAGFHPELDGDFACRVINNPATRDEIVSRAVQRYTVDPPLRRVRYEVDGTCGFAGRIGDGVGSASAIDQVIAGPAIQAVIANFVGMDNA